MSSGMLGALGGPLAVGIGTHLNQQEKSLKQQEALAKQTLAMLEYQADAAKWDSWKQWALAHPDWQSFKEEVLLRWQEKLEEIEVHNESFFAWLESPEGMAEQRLIKAQEKKDLARSNNQKLIKRGIFATAFYGLAMIVALTSGNWIMFFQLLGGALLAFTAIATFLIYKATR